MVFGGSSLLTGVGQLSGRDGEATRHRGICRVEAAPLSISPLPLIVQWRSQDLVSGGAHPLSPFFHSLPSPFLLSSPHPPISPFFLPARPPFPIALPSHKCNGSLGVLSAPPAGPGGARPPNSFWCISPSVYSSSDLCGLLFKKTFNHG